MLGESPRTGFALDSSTPTPSGPLDERVTTFDTDGIQSVGEVSDLRRTDSGDASGDQLPYTDDVLDRFAGPDLAFMMPLGENLHQSSTSQPSPVVPRPILDNQLDTVLGGELDLPFSEADTRFSTSTGTSADHVSIIPSAVADNRISMSGLSVIRAKSEIFLHMYGTGVQIDVWNPRTISPICLGIETQSNSPHFAPTPLQRRIEHHPCLDLFPWSSFRDKFLYVMSLPIQFRPQLAQSDMAAVTAELIMAAKDVGSGIRVWASNPFLPENWEIGQLFYSKFWWSLDDDVIVTTNRLRMQRGESPLSRTFLNAG